MTDAAGQTTDTRATQPAWLLPAGIGIVCLLALFVFLRGDGEPEPSGRVAVSGTVSRNGQPVQSGTLIFRPAPETSGPSASATITAGTFDVPASRGPAAGEYDVIVQTAETLNPGASATPTRSTPGSAGEAPAGVPLIARPETQRVTLIPDKPNALQIELGRDQ